MNTLFNQPEYVPTIPVHTNENNRESEAHLNSNREKFSGKCLLLLQRLCNGERLTFAENVFSIGDLRRRSKDLIENGIPVQREFKILTEEEMAKRVAPIKIYYLKTEDVPKIREKYAKILQL